MHLFILCAVSVFIFQSLCFLIAIIKRDNSLADIGWGLGFILIGAVSFFLQGSPSYSFSLILLLVTLWGLRLSIYLFIRNWWKDTEDWRYAKWRQEWGRYFFLRSYIQVFLLQGLLMLLIALPVMLSGAYTQVGIVAIHSFDYVSIVIGVGVWSMGFFFQAVGDYQLYIFKKNIANKGRVMRYGLWQYTRHPNYFGEAAMWWGIFILSCISAQGIGAIAMRLIGPSLITFLLVRVSGVVMLESRYKGNEEYETYQQSTNSLIPWYPRGVVPTGKDAILNAMADK